MAAKKAQARREQAHKAEQELHDKVAQLQQAFGHAATTECASEPHTRTITRTGTRTRHLKTQQQLHAQLKQMEQALESQKSTSDTTILALDEALTAEREQTQRVTADLQKRFVHLQMTYETLNDSHTALNFRYTKNHADMSRHIAESTAILDEVKQLQIQLSNTEAQHQKTTAHLE